MMRSERSETINRAALALSGRFEQAGKQTSRTNQLVKLSCARTVSSSRALSDVKTLHSSEESENTLNI